MNWSVFQPIPNSLLITLPSKNTYTAWFYFGHALSKMGVAE